MSRIAVYFAVIIGLTALVGMNMACAPKKKAAPMQTTNVPRPDARANGTADNGGTTRPPRNGTDAERSRDEAFATACERTGQTQAQPGYLEVVGKVVSPRGGATDNEGRYGIREDLANILTVDSNAGSFDGEEVDVDARRRRYGTNRVSVSVRGDTVKFYGCGESEASTILDQFPQAKEAVQDEERPIDFSVIPTLRDSVRFKNIDAKVIILCDAEIDIPKLKIKAEHLILSNSELTTDETYHEPGSLTGQFESFTFDTFLGISFQGWWGGGNNQNTHPGQFFIEIKAGNLYLKGENEMVSQARQGGDTTPPFLSLGVKNEIDVGDDVKDGGKLKISHNGSPSVIGNCPSN